MFHNFESSVLEIIEDAKEYTKSHFKLYKLGTESLLYVMFSKEESITRFLLEDYRVTLFEILEAMEDYVLIRNETALYTDKFIEVLEMAKVIAKENKSSVVLEEHLLFALLVIKDTIFESLIKKLNLNSVILIEDLKEYFFLQTTEELDNYSINLTSLAKENKLNKLIGRDNYLDRMKVVLQRKNKNNIILVGSAGVGKTALVEGLCYEFLQEGSNDEIISINISSIVANTKYRGDFEARINKVLTDVASNENKILFIDEIHTIVGAGGSDNSLDVANIIKPYLVRNNFRCIGATTAEEYERYINKDKALARRFQPIFINELSERETLDVLLGISASYALFHNVDLDKKYLDYIVKISKDKITNRKFPDKAIDLMDEAMCIAKINGNKNVSIKHIDEAIKNICGISEGDLNYKYSYSQLEPFYVDNYLGVATNKNLVTINYLGKEDGIGLLLEEIKRGFGFGDESILEINLAHFTESHSISSLIGSPPGYVGYDDGGLLSEHFAKFPHQILILKNYEKAANDIIDFFSSMLTTGAFFDKKGREYNTKNTVFIFMGTENTVSNIGFIKTNVTNKNKLAFDLVLDGKIINKEKNPYIDSLKFKGFDLSFSEEEFSKNPLSFKKTFLNLIRKYEKGKYALSYNTKTNEIEIIND